MIVVASASASAVAIAQLLQHWSKKEYPRVADIAPAPAPAPVAVVAAVVVGMMTTTITTTMMKMTGLLRTSAMAHKETYTGVVPVQFLALVHVHAHVHAHDVDPGVALAVPCSLFQRPYIIFYSVLVR